MGSSRNRSTARTWVGGGIDRKMVLGYKPQSVSVYNITDGISYEKTRTMELEKARKVIADGTATFVDSVQLNDDGFTVIAAESAADKIFHYVAHEGNND